MIPDVTDIRTHLPGYGYTPTDKDDVMIRSCLRVTLARLKAYTNQDKFPDTIDFYEQVISMTIGEFLYRMKVTGKLFADDGTDNGINFKTHLKQLTEGDTSVSMTSAGSTDEAYFNDWINKLRYGDEFILQHYRRLHW